MKIGIMGTPVSGGNRGVMALGAAVINLCLSASPNTEVVLLLSNRDAKPSRFRVKGEQRSIQVVPCRLSPRSRLSDHLFWILLLSLIYRLVPLDSVRSVIVRHMPWIKAIVEADFVGDIRGGDSFSDIYGFSRFGLGFLMAFSVFLIKGTIVQFPQTYGPYKSPLARWLSEYLLRRSSVIIARDRVSQRVAQELVGPQSEVFLSPDVAFSLEPIRPALLQVDPQLLGAVPSGVIGLNVNGLMYNGGYTRNNMFELKMDYAAFLPNLIRALLAAHSGELWLIPHTYAEHGGVESDNEAAEMVRDALPTELRERVRLVRAEYDQHELKWLIGQCDFFIGSRMHACIAALSQGVPCVGVAYSMKFAGVFESVGMQEWVVDARDATNAEAVPRILALYQQRNAVRQELSERADGARRELKEVFSMLVKQASPRRNPSVCGDVRPEPVA